jgi:hypothetical protein
MTEFNRQEQLTTADLAGRRGNFADNLDLQAETRNAEYNEEYVAANPLRPKVVQSDMANSDLRNDAGPAMLESRSSRDWETPRPTAAASAVNDATAATTSAPLFSDSDIGDLRSRWSDVQAGFVDEPRRSVEDADQLVATVMQRLAEGFASERASLERQWDSGDNVSTEDLRVALQRYRAFFGRLLNVA